MKFINEINKDFYFQKYNKEVNYNKVFKKNLNITYLCIQKSHV